MLNGIASGETRASCRPWGVPRPILVGWGGGGAAIAPKARSCRELGPPRITLATDFSHAIVPGDPSLWTHPRGLKKKKSAWKRDEFNTEPPSSSAPHPGISSHPVNEEDMLASEYKAAEERSIASCQRPMDGNTFCRRGSRGRNRTGVKLRRGMVGGGATRSCAYSAAGCPCTSGGAAGGG